MWFQKLSSFWSSLAVWGRYILNKNVEFEWNIFVTEIRTLTQEIWQNYSDEENCTFTICAHMRTDFNSLKTVFFCSRFLKESIWHDSVYTCHNKSCVSIPTIVPSPSTHFVWDEFAIDSFQSRGQQLCKLLGIKESFKLWEEFNSYRILFVHKHGRRFIVLFINMAAVTSCENEILVFAVIRHFQIAHDASCLIPPPPPPQKKRQKERQFA